VLRAWRRDLPADDIDLSPTNDGGTLVIPKYLTALSFISVVPRRRRAVKLLRVERVSH